MRLFIFNFCFILFLNLKKSTQSYIVYPFKRSTKEIKNYPENLLQNDLEVTIKIGTPSQKVDLNLRSEYYTFFVTSSEVQLSYNTFNENNSKSLIKFSNESSSFSNQDYRRAIKISESIFINSKQINNITLVLATELRYNESGALGLKLIYNLDYGDDLSFIYQMKKKANLKNYAFTLKYENDDYGQLIIGSYPHEYDKEYYENNFIFTRTGEIKKNIDWIFDFYDIKYDNKIITGIIKKSLIRIEFGLIQAPLKLKKYFNDTFFLNRCKEEYYAKRNIYIIHCDKNIDITTFKDLSFTLKDINYIFNFNYKDLFIENNDEYIFAIVFGNNVDTPEDSTWILGKPFMKKYQLVFDLDRKIIGLYTKNNNNNDNNNGFNIYLFLLIIAVLIVIGLVIFIVYYFQKTRKKRACELLDDNFDYIPTN